jgi:hypothetical protein
LAFKEFDWSKIYLALFADFEADFLKTLDVIPGTKEGSQCDVSDALSRGKTLATDLV